MLFIDRGHIKTFKQSSLHTFYLNTHPVLLFFPLFLENIKHDYFWKSGMFQWKLMGNQDNNVRVTRHWFKTWFESCYVQVIWLNSDGIALHQLRTAWLSECSLQLSSSSYDKTFINKLYVTSACHWSSPKVFTVSPSLTTPLAFPFLNSCKNNYQNH